VTGSLLQLDLERVRITHLKTITDLLSFVSGDRLIATKSGGPNFAKGELLEPLHPLLDDVDLVRIHYYPNNQWVVVTEGRRGQDRVIHTYGLRDLR
jgi:hypothetical protein